MDLNLRRETIQLNETVFNGMAEHSVELDYLLPDYCPNIFQIVKSSMTATILSKHISQNKLTLDGITFITVLYIGEESGKFHQLEQKKLFSKTIELKEDISGGQVTAHAECSFLNCRAVNGRRLDIRGSLEIALTVTKPVQIPMITHCDGLELHHIQTELASLKQQATKEFTIRETLELGQQKPSMDEVIYYKAVPLWKEQKILTNKLICKGEVLLHTLYSSEEQPDQPQIIEHTLPINQIVDFEGLDESCPAISYFEILEYDMDLQTDEQGECHSFIAILKIRITCDAAQICSVHPIDDCYSTAFETTLQKETFFGKRLIKPVTERCLFKNTLPLDQNEISYLYDLFGHFSNLSYRSLEKSLEISADLKLSILATNRENLPLCLEQTVPCRMVLDTPPLSPELSFDPNISLLSLSYAITSVSELEVRGEVQITGMLYQSLSLQILSDITLSEDHPKEKDPDCALRIYFAEQGENLWEIAKRYNTSQKEILSQNSLESEIIRESGMLFIPIVD